MTRLVRSHPTRHRRSASFTVAAGFTVIEMILVMTLMGLLALLSAGRISTYITERNVRAATSVVQNDVQQAFAIAARNRRPVRITFASSDTALHVADRTNTVTYISRGLGRGSGFMLSPSNVAFCASTCTSASVDVFPNGWASDTLTVTISKGSYSRGIRVSRSGLVTTR